MLWQAWDKTSMLAGRRANCWAGIGPIFGDGWCFVWILTKIMKGHLGCWVGWTAHTNNKTLLSSAVHISFAVSVWSALLVSMAITQQSVKPVCTILHFVWMPVCCWHDWQFCHVFATLCAASKSVTMTTECLKLDLCVRKISNTIQHGGEGEGQMSWPAAAAGPTPDVWHQQLCYPRLSIFETGI